jgi:Kef-type K+ transport system membrane component KefB
VSECGCGATLTLCARARSVTAVVGAYLVGCVVPREGPTTTGLIQRFSYVITTAFVPLYFAASGLKTKFGLLNSGTVWGYTILLLLCSAASKIGGCTVGGHFIGRLPWYVCSACVVDSNTMHAGWKHQSLAR